MNKLSFIKTSLMLTLLSISPIFGMIIEKKLTMNDIIKHDVIKGILNSLHKKDQADMRLVCKKWACKGPDWKFMPDTVEQQYDKKLKQKNTFRAVDKDVILFDLVAKKDFEAAKWIVHSQSHLIRIILKPSRCALSAPMFAIHNKDLEMARLLIESEKHPKTSSWKSYYDKLSVPRTIEQCLYTGNNRDFSFLLYLNAVWSDNANTLKTLYKQKIPTEIGQTLLISQCLEDNAKDCFTFLLKKGNTKKIIGNNNIQLFKVAINTHRKSIPLLFIKNKLFRLNKSISDPDRTILDYYYDDTRDSKSIALLLELGAKRWIDL